jgi:predicted nucleotidyltransferase
MAHVTAAAEAGGREQRYGGAASDRSAAEARLLETLDEALEALRSNRIPFLLIGGLASSVLGRKRWTRDIDVFVHPKMIDYTLRSLAGAGFETRMADIAWLAKADRHGVCVDVIFRSCGGIELDDEMLRRAAVHSFRGRRVPLPPPEDLLVMKALAAREDTSRYWHDAVALAGRPLDWAYLIRRALQVEPQRVASLLLFARTEGIEVPDGTVEALLEDPRA